MYMQKFYIFTLILSCAINSSIVFSQSVLDPTDPVVTYNSSTPPTQPAYGQIGKWVRTVRLSWNTSSYKAYIYKGYAFRLKFPKTYNPTANDGKKYPMMVFFHGLGETGTIYDNEYQLYHGGDVFRDAVDNGKYDGYILCMQSLNYWDPHSYTAITEIIDYMVANNKLDPFWISNNGLSDGGQATWGMLIDHPTYICASVPMSSSSITYENSTLVNTIKFTPMWLFQGGLDGSPAPYTSQQVRNYILAAGGNFTYTEYPDLGHGTWDRVWQEPDFWPFLLRGYASNPWTLYGRTEFCAGDAINVTIGLPPGFDEYLWSNNGVIISGATADSINVKDTGTYSAKVRRGTVWSNWSRTPAHIKIKAPTVTPPITVNGLMSTAIPAPDGKNYVNLQVPDNGYVSYAWKKVGNSSIISTDRIFKVTQAGDYVVSVTEQYGCSSIYSPAFHIINANGTNAPEPAKNLTALTLSNTKIELDWANNPSPAFNETAFEIYRSTIQGASYQFIGQVPADTLTFTDGGLTPNIKYFYIVRAINNNGAAAISNEASASTQSDKTPPTAPANLIALSTTNNSVTLGWDSSTDNVGVVAYDVFVNGIKTNSTTQKSFIVTGLKSLQQYYFYVKARDVSGNTSTQSNQVSAATILQGFSYKYYEGSWNTLPDFNALTPVKTGNTANIDISVRNRDDQFGFVWQGFIKVPIAGTYKFETYSDDGSKIWLGKYDATASPLINNDGLHGGQYVSGTVMLQPGIYPISAAFFEQGGGEVMQLYWTCTALFGDNNRHQIADQYFNDTYTSAGTAPAAPTNFAAAPLDYARIKLSWTDNSNNETGFEIYRSESASGIYVIVGTTSANATLFNDSALLPSTTYYYKIKSINQYGGSALATQKSATTSALPAPPAIATNVKVTVKSSSAISLSWTDNATNETGYSIYRSLSDTLHYKLTTSLPINSTNYLDSGLFAHLTYFYKITVLGVGGTLAKSPTVSGKTKDDAPVITDIASRSVRYGIATAIQVSAADVNGDKLIYSILNKPAFATLINNGDKQTATLTLNPTSAQTGAHNTQIIVNDGNNGKDTTAFTLTVSGNYDPIIDSIANYTITETDSLNVSLTGHDQNNDNLTWSVTGAPANSFLTQSSSNTATLHLRTSYSSSGSYLVDITANDGNGGTAVRQFSLTVNDKNPAKTIFARFMYNDTIGTPWNNITTTTTNNLKDASNSTTNVSLTLQTTWWAAYNGGPQTGNNSGVYPDAVLKDYYYFGIFGGPDSVAAKLSGLDTALKYNLTFYAGSVYSGTGITDNGNTTFTIGGTTVSLYVQNNTKNTVTIYNVKPDVTGSIVFKMGKASNASIGYINALVLNSVYDDGTAPLTPQLISAQTQSNGVKLSWQDIAYNESSYKIFRSTSLSGTYTKIDTTAANVNTYTDITVNGNTQYYYKLQASNKYGNSAFSNVLGVFVVDKAPAIASINNIVIKNNQQLTVNVSATDDAADHVTLKASQLPPFVTFTDNGNGTGKFVIQPTSGTIGYYSGITVTAKDNSDSSASRSFDITVTDAQTSSVYLNFSDGNTNAGKPWNNITTYPSTGATATGIVDQDNVATGISLTFVNGFQGVISTGMRPGNGRTVYPEVVLRAGEYESTTAVRTLRINGLSTTKKYNFVFFNSHEDGLKCLTNFTINGQTVSVDGTYNIDKTVQINNISADANGQVAITVAKGSGADYAFISSLVIQSYDASASILSPADLRITDTKRNAVSLQWQDRSYNETGFQIWRADDSNSTYALLKTVAANTVSYKDLNLTANKSYYYTVKAVTGSVSSNFSNVIVGHTLAYAVYVNFTAAKLAHSPWNNTDAPPQVGLMFNNFYDETDHQTSLSMTDETEFAGDYNQGMNTGNNSGVYPDSVLAESYIVFPGQSGVLNLTGLNVNMKYNFTFTGSAQVTGDINSAYTINDKTVLLDASLNTKGTVTMYDVVPDSNGEVNIIVAPGTATAISALIGAVVIQGFDAASLAIPVAPALQSIAVARTDNAAKKQGLQQNFKDIQIKAYPNPFINNYNLYVNANQNENVNVEMYTMAGKLVYVNKFYNLIKGENTLKIQPNFAATGVYVVRLISENGGQVKILKVVKQ